MDPEATLVTMWDEDLSGAERVEAANDLWNWIDRGGYAPDGITRRALETFVKLTCVVDRDFDGLTLWDCECAECLRIQRDATDWLVGE